LWGLTATNNFVFSHYEAIPFLLGYSVAQFFEALRYNRKVAGPIPNGVIGIFH
jgi:hypothetical protein